MVLSISEFYIIDQYHFRQLKKVFYRNKNNDRKECLPKSACPVANSAMIPERMKIFFLEE